MATTDAEITASDGGWRRRTKEDRERELEENRFVGFKLVARERAKTNEESERETDMLVSRKTNEETDMLVLMIVATSPEIIAGMVFDAENTCARRKE